MKAAELRELNAVELNKKLGEGQNAYYEFVKRTGDPAD